MKFNIFSFNKKIKKNAKPKALGVLLCYNDADILEDAIKALLINNHDIVAWDHGSDDGTALVLDKYKNNLIERKYIPRDFDFYKLYPAMSKNIIKNYNKLYDWVSWPDQDEILEGPSRNKSYYEYITDVFNSPYNWIQFNSFNYWFTLEDDLSIMSPVERIKHYCLFADCAPRIRSWRASKTNIRIFNHNPLPGKQYPVMFNLKHYSMRSEEQMLKRINKDREGLKRGKSNVHYENMKVNIMKLYIKANQLHYDNGINDLKNEVIFNWRDVYGQI
ncbi:MAG: glycosyltransferase family A protein [bacterium]